MKSWPIKQLAEKIKGTLEGADDLIITGVEFIDRAKPGELTFVGKQKYVREWAASRASAAIVKAELGVVAGPGKALIRVPNADLAMAKVLDLFAPDPPACPVGIHPSAVVDPTASVAPDAAIGPLCLVGARVQIGARVRLQAHVTVLDETVIGEDTVLWPGVVVRERCRIGRRCILNANVSIGTDGFGYLPAPDRSGLLKVTHIGSVEIGDDVEIGSGSCVDRGKFGATVIGAGTKIDNLVQVAHNCHIGKNCALSALVGLAGSVSIGDWVVLGGHVGVADHLHVGNGSRVGGKSGVIRDVGPGETVLGYPALPLIQARKSWALMARLPELVKKWGHAADSPGSPA